MSPGDERETPWCTSVQVLTEFTERDDVGVRSRTIFDELGHADPFARSVSSRRGSATRRSEEAWDT